MFSMDSFYKITIYPIICFLSPSSTYHISLCFSFRVAIVSSSLLLNRMLYQQNA